MRLSTLALALIAAQLAGCGMLDSKKDMDYKSAAKPTTSLAVPPDLVLPSADNRYTVPGAAPRGSASASDFGRTQENRPVTDSRILPKVEKASVQRAGNERWLVVQAPPAEVWQVTKNFWQELGFIVNIELPEAGVMETDWAENRAKIPEDSIRRFLGRAMDMFYSTAERDKFRTRLEANANGGTEVFISHRGMVEVYEGTQSGGSEGRGSTRWQPRPSDPEMEAEMLRRLMVHFGVEEKRAESMLAEKSQAQAVLTKTAAGETRLRLQDAFDRAWRRVGLALDRVGFVVEDRDRAGGLYFVRYADLEAGMPKKGFLDKLSFWKSEDDPKKAKRYRVHLTAAGEGSELMVEDEQGAPARGETAQRIVNLLLEQLR
jgi:outer membrane protein assembly factor BamC